jgi:long-chain acyl-CoA synthetase
MSVPRLFNRFYTVIQEGLAKKTGAAKKIIDRAIAVKLENLRTKALYTHSVYDKLVFNKIKTAAFGGRMRIMITGSAPISKDILDFLKISACCPIIEGYGQTETMAGSFLTHQLDPTSGHVGGPTSNCEFKLIDIPEMSYLSTDKDQHGRLSNLSIIIFQYSFL